MNEEQMKILDTVLARILRNFPDAAEDEVRQVIEEGFMAGCEDEYTLNRYTEKHFSF